MPVVGRIYVDHMEGLRRWHRVSTFAVVGALVVGANILVTQGVAQGVGSTPNCMISGLTLGEGRQVSPFTGERAVMFTLTNPKSACKVTGYPGVTLRDSDGRTLAFTYTHTSSYVTKSAPKSIVLAHGATIYFLVAKYRCDKGDARTAKTISVSALSSIDSSGPLTSSAAVIARFTYCKGGSSDPGQRVSVSPVTATWASALPANQYPNGKLSACSFIDSWPKKTVTADVVAAVTTYYAAKKLTPITIENNREWILNVKQQSVGTHWCVTADGGKSGYTGSVPPQATAAVMVFVKHKPYPVTQFGTHFVTLAMVAGAWKVVGEGTGP
jgi:hypothetical protein